MIYNAEWEYENQDYLKRLYERKISGEEPNLAVRKIYCKGCGRVFYTQIKTKKYSPANYMAKNIGTLSFSEETIGRFEKLFSMVNSKFN